MKNGYKFIVKNDTVTSRGYVPKGAVDVVTNLGNISKFRFEPYIMEIQETQWTNGYQIIKYTI